MIFARGGKSLASLRRLRGQGKNGTGSCLFIGYISNVNEPDDKYSGENEVCVCHKFMKQTGKYVFEVLLLYSALLFRT